jgi:DNA (cytosine-5)-methyltransferase 1
MGFPDSFQIPVSDTQAYQQFSLAAVVPIVKEVAQIMMPSIMKMVTENKQRVANGD